MDTGMFAPLDSLIPWSENPRAISTDSFQRLKNHIESLGIHSPLLVTPEGGRLIVLGGNMRLRAIKELAIDNPEKYSQVWVNIVEFVIDENNGLFSAYLNGVRQPKTFVSREAAMMEYSLSHNDRAGFYDADMLANIMPNYEIDWNDYTVDLDAPQTVTDLVNSIAPENPEPKEETVQEKWVCKCPDCGRVFDPEDYAVKEGIESEAV